MKDEPLVPSRQVGPSARTRAENFAALDWRHRTQLGNRKFKFRLGVHECLQVSREVARLRVSQLRFCLSTKIIMQQNSSRHSRRRSSSNPVRISAIEREDKSFTRTDQRRTQTLKSKGMSIGEASHIPRPRFRSSSSDRAGSLGRKSYLKTGTV